MFKIFSFNDLNNAFYFKDGTVEFEVEVSLKMWMPEIQLAKFKCLLDSYLSKV